MKDTIFLTHSVGVAATTTYLRVLGGLVSDISGNVITNLTFPAVGVRGLTPDSVLPNLLSWTLDMNYGGVITMVGG